ncbi:putative bifunctional diguanylate cyclase/phosphodiesterase [Dactylosporangium fulvum]
MMPKLGEPMKQSALRNSAPPRNASRFVAYVATITVAAVGVLLVSLPGGFPSSLPAAFWCFAAFAILADTPWFVQAGPDDVMPAFPSVCFTFAVMLAFGFAPAVLVQLGAVAVAAVWLKHAAWRAAFNAGQYVLSFAAAAALFDVVLPDQRADVHTILDGGMPVLWIVVVGGCWFLVNNLLVSTAVWLRFGGRWPAVFKTALGNDALPTGALLLSAPGLVATAYVDVLLVPLALVPLFAVRRMTKLSLQRARAARLDPLTGLGNRKALERAVANWVPEHAERAEGGADDRRLALLLLDLDGFKQVNEALGHRVGDRLLEEVAGRLTGAAGAGLVGRLGGDEFAVVVPHLRDTLQAREHAAGMLAALAEPVLLDGLPIDVGGSVGVAVYPEHGGDFEELLQHADVAMYDAKARGDNLAVYAPESDHNTPERLSLLADLRRALESPEGTGIELYYQPQVELATGAVVGLEALLRWRHPVRGPVDPEELIKVAEHSSVMRLLTLRIVDEVINQLAAWGPAADGVRVAVNVSVRDLHTGEIADRIAARLRETAVDSSRLELEITESALMADPRRVLATLARLERLGVAIALDDFGTGYSSMLHLRRLPLAEVKIDRSFVLGLATDPDDAAIVRSMIDLARALGLRVVAEGVENERTWRLLVEAGCDLAQGWYFARPMPPAQLIEWLARRNRSTVAHSA